MPIKHLVFTQFVLLDKTNDAAEPCVSGGGHYMGVRL